MATFSQRLSQLRKERDLTQEQLAIALNITRSRLSMYEQGKREPDFELQETIADFFNVDMDYLHGRNKEKLPAPSYDSFILDVMDILSNLSTEQKNNFKEFVKLYPQFHADQAESLLQTARIFARMNNDK